MADSSRSLRAPRSMQRLSATMSSSQSPAQFRFVPSQFSYLHKESSMAAAQAKDHHHLRRHRLDPYADDDPASADHAGADRRRIDRGGKGRRRDHSSACPRSQGRAADARSQGVHGVPAGDQAELRRRHQHHHRRRPQHDGAGAARRAARRQARDVLVQHGLDELRALPEPRSATRSSSTTGSRSTSRRAATSSSATPSRTWNTR